MNSQFILLLTGYTAVGKSTLGKKISNQLNVTIFHSAIVRNELGLAPKKSNSSKIFNFKNNLRSNMDNLVYNELVQRADKLLYNKKNVIIDAGNFLRSRRSNFYERANKFDTEVYVIKLICSDEETIINRLNNRLENYEDSAFNEAPTLEIYNSTKVIMEDPINDIMSNGDRPNLIEYDTFTQNLKQLNKNSNSDRMNEIIKVIDK